MENRPFTLLGDYRLMSTGGHLAEFIKFTNMLTFDPARHFVFRHTKGINNTFTWIGTTALCAHSSSYV